MSLQVNLSGDMAQGTTQIAISQVTVSDTEQISAWLTGRGGWAMVPLAGTDLTDPDQLVQLVHGCGYNSGAFKFSDLYTVVLDGITYIYEGTPNTVSNLAEVYALMGSFFNTTVVAVSGEFAALDVQGASTGAINVIGTQRGAITYFFGTFGPSDEAVLELYGTNDNGGTRTLIDTTGTINQAAPRGTIEWDFPWRAVEVVLSTLTTPIPVGQSVSGSYYAI